jgi:hypothetical protein
LMSSKTKAILMMQKSSLATLAIPPTRCFDCDMVVTVSILDRLLLEYIQEVTTLNQDDEFGVLICL